MSNTNVCIYKKERWKSNIEDIVKFCEDKSVCIYGAGYYGQFTKEKLEERGVKIKKFFVSNMGDNQNNIDYIPVEIATKEKLKNEKIIISIHAYQEIEEFFIENKIDNYKVLQVEFIMPIIEEKTKIQQKYISAFEDGTFRVRITNKCPGKCDFCGMKNMTEEDRNTEMNYKWYMEYMRPLYSKLKTVLITGGDAFFASHSYEYMKMLSDEYKHISIYTESNGMTFSKKFQKLACDNLFTTHFSLNASNAITYAKGCWSSEGGEKAYKKCIENVNDYILLLKQNNRIEFAPNISMVINSRTADDVVEFIKMALKNDFSYVVFYFDYLENDMSGDYFANPDIMRPILKQLLELEYLLKDKFYIQFRLWVPLKELDIAEKELQLVSLYDLQEKYDDIFQLAKNRSIEGEHNKRNYIRRNNGKRELTKDEEYSLTLRTFCVKGNTVCAMGWNSLDLYPNGRLDFCGWHIPTLFFPDYIKNDSVDWNEIINSNEFLNYREKMLKGDYSGCMSCCPIIRELGAHG